MIVKKQDIEDFSRFAIQQLEKGPVDSLGKLLAKWEMKHDHEAAVADVQAGIRDHHANKGSNIPDAFLEIRKQVE